MLLHVVLVIAGIAVASLVLIGFVLDLSVPAQPLEPAETDADAGEPEPRDEVRFEVGGAAISAWLFLPEEGPAPLPCIVMAHGFGGTKDCGLDRYAGGFRAAGFAVLAFDYRHFGASEGEPRQLYWNPHQLEDWAAAVAYAQSLPEVDASRIALWGSSASGGHIIVTAAENPGIKCVSAQCPGLDPRSDGRRLVSRLGARRAARLILHGQRDMIRSRFGLSAHRIPNRRAPGDGRVLRSAGCLPGLLGAHAEGLPQRGVRANRPTGELVPADRTGEGRALSGPPPDLRARRARRARDRRSDRPGARGPGGGQAIPDRALRRLPRRPLRDGGARPAGVLPQASLRRMRRAVFGAKPRSVRSPRRPRPASRRSAAGRAAAWPLGSGPRHLPPA